MAKGFDYLFGNFQCPLRPEICCVAKTDRLRNNTGATFSSWEEDVAKLRCLYLLNGNRILQQRFMLEISYKWSKLEQVET